MASQRLWRFQYRFTKAQEIGITIPPLTGWFLARDYFIETAVGRTICASFPCGFDSFGRPSTIDCKILLTRDMFQLVAEDAGIFNRELVHNCTGYPIVSAVINSIYAEMDAEIADQ